MSDTHKADDVIERNGPDYLRGQIEGLQTAVLLLVDVINRPPDKQRPQDKVLYNLQFNIDNQCGEGSLHFMNGKREMLEALLRNIKAWPRSVP